MTFLSSSSHLNFDGAHERGSEHTMEQAYNMLLKLHQTLSERARHYDWDLHPHPKKSSLISRSSATTSTTQANVLTLSYFRSAHQTQLVENLMHIDTANCPDSGEPYRHPVLELRFGADYFAIELVLSPFARWDQQNLIGKLELKRHRATLRQLISSMDSDYRFGFWEGTDLSDMHLTTWELSHGRVLEEWMNTFAEGQDWLRFGMWYDVNSEEFTLENMLAEAPRRIADLYTLYDFMLWTSNNNFQSFYDKREKALRRAYA